MVWSFLYHPEKIKNVFKYGFGLFIFLIIKHLGIVTNLLLDSYYFFTLYLCQQASKKIIV